MIYSMKMVSNVVNWGRFWKPLFVRLFCHQGWGGHNKKKIKLDFSNAVNPKCNPVGGEPHVCCFETPGFHGRD